VLVEVNSTEGAEELTDDCRRWSNVVTVIDEKWMIESALARVRTLPTIIETDILIFGRDNLSSLKTETHELNFMVRCRKNCKGHANVLRKLRRVGIGTRPFGAQAAFGEPYTLGSMFTLGVLLLANSAVMTGLSLRKLFLGMLNCLPP
jgi:hypothetical protein